jgi:hypothetical protein
MPSDSGASVQASGRIVAADHPAYAFGAGDFTVETLFLPSSAGTLVSKKSTAGGSPANAGWLLVLRPDGSIKFATDNGFGYYEIDSAPTSAFDGEWHHVAGVRLGGQLTIFFDGSPIQATPRGSLPTPLNVSGQSPVVVGATDQVQEPYNQFVGLLDDVALWNRGLSAQEILPTMFNGISGNEPGLVGYWPLNSDTQDGSPTHNNAAIVGNVTFVPVFHCIWVNGANAYSYCAIDTHFNDAGRRSRKDGPPVTVTRKQKVMVAAGTPFLYAAVNAKGETVSFPAGVNLAVARPDGSVINSPSNTDQLYVAMSGTSVWQMIVRNPTPGAWVVTITAPSNIDFDFWMQTVPSIDIVGTITSSLAAVNADHTAGPAAKRAALSLSWGSLAMTAGAMIATAAFALTAPVSLSTALIVGLTAVAVEQAVFIIETMSSMPTVTASSQFLAAAVGFDPNNVAEYGLALSGGYVTALSNNAYNFGLGDFTVEAWVKPTKPGPILGRKSSGGGNSQDAGFLFQVNPNGVISLVSDNGFGYYLVNSYPTKVLDGLWHHIAATRQSGQMHVYFDGQQIAVQAASSLATPLNVSNALPLFIGSVAQQQQPYRFYQGLISELRIWNYARSSVEIKTHMNVCVDETLPTLAGYWPFVTQDANDISKIGNNGSIQGAATFVAQPGAQLVEIQLGRNAASGYSYVGEHTFICIMNSAARTAAYPNNVYIFFDCAGGHGDAAGHQVPVNLGSIIVRGRTNDLITMATGSTVIDPAKRVYGSGDEFGQGTCGIDATGTINRNGFCHQIANRLLYAATWPNRQVTLSDAVPFEVRGYWITVAWTGVYGASWASIWNGKQLSFADWCAQCGFPAPRSDAEALHQELRFLAPDKRRAFIEQAAQLSATIRPSVSAEELAEAETRFRANMAATLDSGDRERMGFPRAGEAVA